jgi:hypothetical protein
MEPRRVFARGGTVVVEQSAQWRTPEGQVTEPQTVASVFRVRDGQVVAVLRYPDMQAALEAAGLDETEEVALDQSEAAGLNNLQAAEPSSASSQGEL